VKARSEVQALYEKAKAAKAPETFMTQLRIIRLFAALLVGAL